MSLPKWIFAPKTIIALTLADHFPEFAAQNLARSCLGDGIYEVHLARVEDEVVHEEVVWVGVELRAKHAGVILLEYRKS